MTRRELKKKADAFLRETTDRLACLPRETIENWPSFPSNAISIEPPVALSRYRFHVLKNVVPDGRIRIAVTRYRDLFFGFREGTADGFFVESNGNITRFKKRDIYSVT